MRVLEMVLSNVMTHRDTKIILPRSGLVLVCGPNGAGKSALIEAVSVGVWGKPLRGKPIWCVGEQPSSISLLVEVGSDTYLIQRSKKHTGAGKEILRFGLLSGDDLSSHDTKTRAQAALDELVGPHDLWARSSVFSSHDAVHFSLATDAQRKELIEAMLGMSRFDAAYEDLKKQRTTAARVLDKATEALRDAQEGVNVSRATLSALEAVPPLQDEPQLLDLALLDARLRDTTASHGALVTAADVLREEIGDLQSNIAVLKARRNNVLKDRCDRCEQLIDATHARTLAEQIDAELARDQATLKAAVGALKKREAQLEVARASLSDAQAARTAAIAAQRVAARIHAQRLAQAQQVAVARQRLQEAEEVAADRQVAVDAARVAAANLDAAVEALSMRGIRALLLERALGGIADAANAWLSRVSRPERPLLLTLRSYSQNKDGSLREAIGMQISGAGGAHGYDAASGGERRRIDIAIMLALGEIAEAASGMRNSTLFFDEAFDALDAEGADLACSLLAELAQDRCVVVISHNAAIKQGLKPVVTLDLGKA